MSEKRPTLDHLTPDRVLDIGYCVHVVDNWPAEKEPNQTLRLAKAVVADFWRLKKAFPADSPEGQYLFSVSQMIVSLSRGIARSKQLLAEQKQKADFEYQESRVKLSQSSQVSGLWQGFRQYAFIGGLGTLGFMVMKGIVPWLPLATAERQPTVLSICAGLSVLLLSSYIKSKITDLQVSRAFALHQYRHWFAEQLSDINSQIEYERAKHGAQEAWKRCKGFEAPEWPGYETMLAQNLQLRDEYWRNYNELTAGTVRSVWTILTAKLRRRNKNSAAIKENGGK